MKIKYRNRGKEFFQTPNSLKRLKISLNTNLRNKHRCHCDSQWLTGRQRQTHSQRCVLSERAVSLHRELTYIAQSFSAQRWCEPDWMDTGTLTTSSKLDQTLTQLTTAQRAPFSWVTSQGKKSRRACGAGLTRVFCCQRHVKHLDTGWDKRKTG